MLAPGRGGVLIISSGFYGTYMNIHEHTDSYTDTHK